MTSTSLRTRLFLILVAATGMIWLFAIGWIYVGTKQEVESVLDARLQEAARMVVSLGTSRNVALPPAETGVDGPAETLIDERQLACQIWSLDGRLVARSRGAPSSNLGGTQTGFSDRRIEGENWRVFTLEDADRGLRVLVGDRLGVREHLVTDIIKGLLAPTLLIVPLLGFLIWTSLNRGLRPLRTLALELQQRRADDISSVETGRAPAEILPMMVALNALFSKVETARRHEREITAFAAHELRTPLAGLRRKRRSRSVRAIPLRAAWHCDKSSSRSISHHTSRPAVARHRKSRCASESRARRALQCRRHHRRDHRRPTRARPPADRSGPDAELDHAHRKRRAAGTRPAKSL